MITGVIITLFLIALNGFFVAAEFSMVKARLSRIEQSNSKFKKYALLLLGNIESYISATQLGITIASLALGWIGEQTFEHIFEYIFNVSGNITVKSICVFLSFSLVTTMHIIFGELIPKAISIRTPNSFILIASYPVYLFHFIFKPIIYVMNSTANICLKMLGYSSVSHNDDSFTEEEVRILVEDTIQDNSTKEIIDNAFDFNEKTVREIMIPRTKVIGIEVTSKDEEIVKALKEGYTRMPVYNKSIDSITGIANAKDILMYFKENNKISLSTIMKQSYFIPESMPLKDLLQAMKKKHIHMAIVIDEHGGTAGIVTLENVLEELVGDIKDEHDEDEILKIVKIDDITFDVASDSSIEDLQEHLRYPLPEGSDFDTVSGLVNFIFNAIPKQGQVKEFGGYSFKILKATKYKVIQVRIKELLTIED